MCCGTERHHSGWHWGGHRCGHPPVGFCACAGPSRFGFGPCFSSRDEKITWLERVLEGLQEEAKAVEERIAELRAEE